MNNEMEYFGTNLTEAGHYRWNITANSFEERSLRFTDLPFHPEELTRNLPFGEVIFYQGGGFTVIGISGSCKDDRRGTKSIFWVKGLFSREEMIQKIKNNELAKKIIIQMPFQVKF